MAGPVIDAVSVALRSAVASRYWSEREARAVLEAFAASGLGAAAFCRRYGIGTKRLGWWKARLDVTQPLAGRSADAMPTLVPLRVIGGGEAELGARATGHGSFEVLLRSGRVIRLGTDFDPGALRRLVAVLDDVAC